MIFWTILTVCHLVPAILILVLLVERGEYRWWVIALVSVFWPLALLYGIAEKVWEKIRKGK